MSGASDVGEKHDIVQVREPGVDLWFMFIDKKKEEAFQLPPRNNKTIEKRKRQD